MACKVNLQSIDTDTLRKLKSKAVLKFLNHGKPEHVLTTRLLNNFVFIPFALAKHCNLQNNNTHFPTINIIFNGKLRENQLQVKNEAMEILEDTNSVVISCFTGFGKTIGAIDLACEFRLKTLIVVTRLVLMKQWKDALLSFVQKEHNHNEFIPVVEIVSSSCKDDYVMCDFAIINAINIPKMEVGFLESFGTVIIDEVHLVLAKKTFRSLLYLAPKYLIALSATSYRSDGLDGLFPLFFGKHKIERELNIDHTIYRVNTGFKPEVKYSLSGKIDWNAMLKDQAMNPERNRLIVEIVRNNSGRTFLILVKRIKQGEWLAEEIGKFCCVSTLFGPQQDFDKSCNVLIGTSSKIGTGFDFTKLDTLLLAADVVEYYIQFIGRIMRRRDVNPIIFDLVDNNSTLLKHYFERVKIYKKHGGTIKVYT